MSIIERCHDRWANLHPLWRFLAVIAAVAGIAFAAGRPALGVYRDWRDGERLKEAARAGTEGRHAEARELTLAVLRRDGSRSEAIPLLLQATEALDDPRQAEVALALLADPEASPADRAFAWRVSCENSPAWILQAAWSGLTESERSTVDFVAPLFDRMLRDGMIPEAALLLAPLPAPLPAELEERLMRLLVAKGTDEAFDEFQRTLIGRLPQLPADTGIVALLDEVPQGALRPGLHGALLAWHKQHPPSGPEADLRLARCHMAADPEKAEAIFTDTLARHRAAAPLAAARWCLQVRQLAEADEILTGLPSSADEAAFRLHCQVREQLGDAGGRAALLAAPPAGIPAAWVACELAHLANLRRDAKARDAAADTAFKSAAEIPASDALIQLARHAGQRQLSDLARRAWLEAVRRRSGPLPMSGSLKGIIEALATDKKETELLEILTAYRLLEPGNPVIMVQHDYLACLGGRLGPESLVGNLKPIHDKLPDALPVSCVLALGHLLTGQPAAAVELTDKDIDWFAASPAYRAIRGLALQAAGRHEEAATFLDDFPWNALLPSEKRVLQGLAETQGAR